MALPFGTTGSLRPTFVPARLVGLAVKLPYAFTLDAWFPIRLREPSRASVTLWEATAPVKLPTRQCPPPGSRVQVRFPKSIRVVFQRWLHRDQSPGFKASHLSYTNQFRKSMSSCSKGSRGLSVLPRVKGIFTPSATSLSPCSRQWGSRYAIRAGRNLPDKEFRYLRTVIVTAAVYRGFGSNASPCG